MAIYKGTSGQWDQIQYSSVTGSYVDPIAASRQSLLGLAYSDGATSSRRIEWTMGAAGNVAGSALSEVGHVFRVPASNPSVSGRFFVYSSTATPVGTEPHLIMGYLRSDGALVIQTNGVSSSSNNRIFAYAGFRSAYSGQLVRVDIVLVPGTTDPVVYINGVDASASFAASTTGTAPDWMASTLVAAYRVSGLNWPSGEFRPGVPINRALAAAEIAQMVQTGALLPRDRTGGSVVQLVTNGDMSSSTGWTLGSGWSITGGHLVHTASSNFGAATQGIVLEKGATYEYSFNLVSRSGAVLLFQQGTNTTILPAGGTGTYSGVFVATESGTVGFKNSQNGAMEAVIDDFSLRRVGALIQPEITRTAQVLDQGPNRIRGVMHPGVRPLCESAPVGIRGTQTATGFLFGLGSTAPIWFEPGLITAILIKQASASAQTITLRLNSSGGTVIATATTSATTSWQRLTFDPFEVTNGDRLHWTITGQIDFDIEWSRR